MMRKKSHEINSQYIHHQKTNTPLLRELIFGMEDGMVSTLGSVIGIAGATQNVHTTILAGLVIVSVESVSMAVGSYLSSKSVRAIDDRKVSEEREELQRYPKEEREELVGFYIRDGWSIELATQMAEAASKNPTLFLKEMSYRELAIVPGEEENPLKNGTVMWGAYVVGGMIPLVAFFVLPLTSAIPVAILITLSSLFGLGVYTTKFSKRTWWKAGLEMLVLATAAAAVGYGVGQWVDTTVVLS